MADLAVGRAAGIEHDRPAQEQWRGELAGAVLHRQPAIGEAGRALTWRVFQHDGTPPAAGGRGGDAGLSRGRASASSRLRARGSCSIIGSLVAGLDDRQSGTVGLQPPSSQAGCGARPRGFERPARSSAARPAVGSSTALTRLAARIGV